MNINRAMSMLHIDIIGSAIKANALNLTAANQVNIESAQNTYQNRSSNSSSGWSMGAFATLSGDKIGVGVEASAQKGKGRENTDTVTHQLTALKANTLNLSTQGDTTLKGATIQAETIKADIQKNLMTESEQDTNRHKSKHTQGSVGASAVILGTGSGASFNASHSKAKLNYQQVHTQSGLTAGQGGLQLNVGQHTHLKGGVIDSTAPTEKNTFSTKTLTAENILNHSEMKVQSASVGLSTNLEANKLAAVGTVASAVGGNIHQEDSSTTYSVIGQNISLNVKEGSIPDNLRQDKEGANQKVQHFDKADAQERMEMAQVMGEISQNTITIALQPMLDKAEAQKAEAEKALKDESLTAAQRAYYTEQLNRNIETLHTYGKGSDLQLGIRAATGVLQGLATGNTNAAIVGGLSPFLNKAIKEATTDKATNKVNLFANTVAHAILGAVEAKMLNTNVAAGAAGAVVGEATAHIIADKLYQKSPEALTEQEKATISALSQVVAGLSGVAVGDNFQSAVVSSEIGKRAVENNYLTIYKVE
ncbi:hemagglutination protein, partial [Pelistega sp. NLN82]